MQFEKGFYNNNNNSFCYTRILFSSTLFSILFYILRLLKILICYYCGKSLANDIHMALECKKNHKFAIRTILSNHFVTVFHELNVTHYHEVVHTIATKQFFSRKKKKEKYRLDTTLSGSWLNCYIFHSVECFDRVSRFWFIINWYTKQHLNNKNCNISLL